DRGRAEGDFGRSRETANKRSNADRAARGAGCGAEQFRVFLRQPGENDTASADVRILRLSERFPVRLSEGGGAGYAGRRASSGARAHPAGEFHDRSGGESEGIRETADTAGKSDHA